MKIKYATLSLVALVVSLAGCKKEGAEKTSPAVAFSSPATFPKEVVSAALAQVPGESNAVVTLALPHPIWDYVTGKEFAFIPWDEELRSEMEAELKSHLQKHAGLDVEKTQVAIAFAQVSKEMERNPAVGVIVPGISGELNPKLLTGLGTSKIADATVYEFEKGKAAFSIHKGTLYAGTPLGVRMALETAAGTTKPLREVNSEFFSYLEAMAENSWISASGDVQKVLAAIGEEPPPQMAIYIDGLTRVGISVRSSGASIEVRGKEETLNNLKAPIDVALNAAQQQMKNEKDSSVNDPAKGAAAILGYYSLANAIKLIRPQVEGDALRMRLTFSEGSGSMTAMLVPVSGILAAVAIPAFMKYIKKSKTAEARTFIKKLYDGARVYHMENGSFPTKSVEIFGDPSCCAAGGANEKCDPANEDWNQEPWRSLRFSVNDPHYYAYGYQPEADPKKGFTVYAYGDLDCDGELSTFSMYGAVGPSGEVSGSPTIARENELE